MSMNRIIDFLIAPRGKCMGCGALTGSDNGWLCSDCYGSLKPLYTEKNASAVICAHCGTVYFGGGFCTGCRRKNVELLKAPAAFVYDGPVREIIHNFKFKGTYRMADYMAGYMKKALETEEIGNIDLIVPVPLHKNRFLERGYNQSEKLAKALTKLISVPMVNALERTRSTKSQSSLNGTQRRVNLDGAFRADERVKGKSVLLIDDVRTTGTTAVKCAEALFSAGARDVTVLTFAQAEPKDGSWKKYR